MRVADEHCRDNLIHDLQGNPLQQSIGRMRRMTAAEHQTTGCSGTWSGNGFCKFAKGELREHLVCTRCGYQV
jgi:hypothetical protein